MSINGSTCSTGLSLTIVSTTPWSTTLLESFEASVSVRAMAGSPLRLHLYGVAGGKTPSALRRSRGPTDIHGLDIRAARGDVERDREVLDAVGAAGGGGVLDAE